MSDHRIAEIAARVALIPDGPYKIVDTVISERETALHISVVTPHGQFDVTGDFVSDWGDVGSADHDYHTFVANAPDDIRYLLTYVTRLDAQKRDLPTSLDEAAHRRRTNHRRNPMTLKLEELQFLYLDAGSHETITRGACLLEAVAHIAGEPHSDHPVCVSPYLRHFGARLNDLASDERRQDLIRFIPRLIGTAGDGLDGARRWLGADFVARVTAPKWLDRAGLTEHAQALRGLPAITDFDSHRTALPAIRAARDAARALWRDRRVTIRAAVKKALEERPAAVADAAAGAGADAVAVAVAVAVAAAVAVADADAVAGAGADAAAWVDTYDAVYGKVRAIYEQRYTTFADESWQDALSLFDALITPAVTA